MHQNHNFQAEPIKNWKIRKSRSDQPPKLVPISESAICILLIYYSGFSTEFTDCQEAVQMRSLFQRYHAWVTLQVSHVWGNSASQGQLVTRDWLKLNEIKWTDECACLEGSIMKTKQELHGNVLMCTHFNMKSDSEIVMVDLAFGDDFFKQNRSWDDSGTTISGI